MRRKIREGPMYGKGSITPEQAKKAVKKVTARRGTLSVVTGPMFSGKTQELIRRFRRAEIANKKAVVLKHVIDDRYEGTARVCTHDGVCIKAKPVSGYSDISRLVGHITPPDLVIIDEVQFFSPGYIINSVQDLTSKGMDVLVVGTDTDFRGNPFGGMGHLMCIADEVLKLTSICVSCGEDATRNQRVDQHDNPVTDEKQPIIKVGAKDTYEARCKNCFE